MSRRSIVLSMVVLAGCVSTPHVGVSTFVNESIDVSKSETFAWIGEAETEAGSEQFKLRNEAVLIKAINSELGSKGYTLTDGIENADFVLTYAVQLNDEGYDLNLSTGTSEYFIRNGRKANAYRDEYWEKWSPSYETIVTGRAVGALTIDAIDTESGLPVWRATGTKNITISGNSQIEAVSIIKEVAVETMRDFPDRSDN